MKGLSFWKCIIDNQGIGRAAPAVKYAQSNNLYKDFVYSWFGPRFMVVAVDPESTKWVLKSPGIEKTPLFTFSKKTLENFSPNVLSKEGDDWRRHRTIINPGFTNDAIMNYFPSFLHLVDKSINTIPLNSDLELSDFFSRFTLDVLGKTIFNHDFNRIDGKNDQYYNAYKKILGFFNTKTGMALMLLPWIEDLPLKGIKEFHSSIDLILQFFNEMIEQHKDKDEDSILAKLIKSGNHDSSKTDSNNNDGTLSRQELIANIWIFFLAGHDTTSSALTWALNCLREYPDIQEKVYNEIQSVIGDKIPTHEDLDKLVYLDCFIQEVLRLHPPVSSLASRVATEDLKYKDKVIPKGTRVGIFFHIVQTNPEFWEDPLKFDPDRFKPENKKGRNHFMHLPFSAGLRQCIGTQFSLVEQRLFLTRLVQKYKVVDPVSTPPFPMDDFVVLGKYNSVNVRFEPRNVNNFQ